MDRRPPEPDDLQPLPFEEEDAADFRRTFRRQAIRVAIAFLVLFLGVYLALSWSGAAIRFSAARAADRATPTWIVTGTVRDANTGAPIPWARVEDDPAGQAPFFQADADHRGKFELRTLSLSHRLRVSASGYRDELVPAGRAWFLWMPRGRETVNIRLAPK